MTDSFCGYQGDRDEAIVAFLYDDGGDARERAAFEAHLMTCARCRDELAALRGVRAQLARWAPPEPAFSRQSQSAIRNPQSAIRNGGARSRRGRRWRRRCCSSACPRGIANLDVRYDANGLSVRTGWSTRSCARRARRRVGSLDGRVRERRRAPGSDRAPGARISPRSSASCTTSSAAMQASTRAARRRRRTRRSLRRVRALVDESERRQQRELALRVAEVMRDVNAQRQADLVKIDRNLGAVQNNLGVEVLKERQRLNSLMHSHVADGSRGTCETACIDARRGNGHRGRGAGGGAAGRGRRRPRAAAEQRYQIGQMERVLEGAVEHGVTIIRDRVQELAQVPAELLVSDNARARGFRLDGYGVFFDVIVPSFDERR